MSTASRIFFFFFGLAMKSFGFSCIIISNLGTGAWEGLYVGLSQDIGLSVGLWLILIGVVITFINGLLLKKRPSLLSLITVLLVGALIDLWIHILNVHILDIKKQLIVFGMGLFFAALGVALYVQAEFAITPLDQLMIALSKTFGISLMLAKTTSELIALILAIAIQGPIGVGTIVFSLLFGPLIQFFMKQVHRVPLIKEL